MLVTLGIGIIDQQKGTCEYASAGHMAPYRLNSGLVTQIPCSSLPLGISKDETYSQVIIPFEPGDRFVFYTDGVVETFTDTGEMFGFQGLEYCLSRLDPAASAQEQLDALVRQLPKSQETHTDDRTIILVEYDHRAALTEKQRKAANPDESKRNAG